MLKTYDKPKFLPQEEWAYCLERMPLVSIDLIVENQQGQVLLGWRSNRPAKGSWFVPGGVVRKGELLTQAFKRTLFNELGASVSDTRVDQIRNKSFVGIFEHHYADNFLNENFGTHYVVMAHKLTVASLLGDWGELVLPTSQHQKYCWMQPSEILLNEQVHENTKAYFL